jgi:hypothetical protein
MSKIPSATPLTPALEPPPWMRITASGFRISKAPAHMRARGSTLVEPPSCTVPLRLEVEVVGVTVSVWV